MDISIIIVNFNTCDLTDQAIDSVLTDTKRLQIEIIVVDNNSSDGSQSFLTSKYCDTNNVSIILNTENLGFSKANNLAIKQATGDYILLLNSDTIVEGNCLLKCTEYIRQSSEIGALGCKVLLPNGDLDHACKRGFPTPSASLFYFLKLHQLFPQNKKYGAYTMSYINDNEIGEVDALTGAFMLIPKKVLNQIGLLDEDFFMYGEDIDLCFRIKESGYKIIYYPEAKITHLKRQSSNKKRYKTIYEFHRAMILFYNKHYVKKYNFAITFIVYICIIARLAMTYFLNLFKARQK